MKLHEHHFSIFGVFCLCCIFYMSSCSPYPPADYYETDGIISIDINADHETSNWKSVHHINSDGIISETIEPDSSKSVEFSFYLSNPGSYSFWVLTTGYNIPDKEDLNEVVIIGPDNFMADRFQFELPDDDRLLWTNKRANSEAPLMLDLNRSGFYKIRIHPGETEGIQVHKIHMSLNDHLKPSGLGLPSSTNPDINAADLFREQSITLPPAWYFGLILGATGSINEESDSLIELDETPIFPDAYWTSAASKGGPGKFVKSLNNTGIVPGFYFEENTLFSPDSLNQNGRKYFERGYKFAITDADLSIEQVELLYGARREADSTIERGLVIRNLKESSAQDTWQYPALGIRPAEAAWSSSPGISGSSYKPGGLAELLEAVANPRLSTYNNPYLSLPIQLDDMQSDDSVELLIRYFQLASFLPVMHLQMEQISENPFPSLSQEYYETLHAYRKLRGKLFPYIYTYAHVTRQTGKGIIEGFRDHPDQFRFGDAFIVAPITEEGKRRRSVYFPGEGIWYDADTGRSYRAGQSWVVEASLQRIPLFVKAGSVIPYRTEPDLIRNGTNDPLHVEIFTGDAGTFRLVEDDGVSLDYGRSRAARTMFRYNEVAGRLRLTIGAVQSDFEGMKDSRTYTLYFRHTDRPQQVLVNEEGITENNPKRRDENQYWSYDEESSTLKIVLQNQWKHERTEITIKP